jgi:hypothetical protein
MMKNIENTGIRIIEGILELQNMVVYVMIIIIVYVMWEIGYVIKKNLKGKEIKWNIWEITRRMTQGEILEVGGDGTPGDVPPGDVTPGGEDPSTKWKKYVIKLLKYIAGGITVGISVYIGYKIFQGGDGGGGGKEVVKDIVKEIVNDIGDIGDIAGRTDSSSSSSSSDSCRSSDDGVSSSGSSGGSRKHFFTINGRRYIRFHGKISEAGPREWPSSRGWEK